MMTSTENTVAEFYDRLASDYDTMTGFKKRFTLEQPVFRDLLHRYPIATALDAGCGTGFHSLLLSQLGVHVTGVDVSPEMIARAVAHGRDMGLSARFVESHFQDVRLTLDGSIDAVFCLGNSLAHLESRDQLLGSLHAFFSVLHDGGTLFIQVLNYERIISQKNRIQSVREEGNTMFVRFYDFESEFIQFNILKILRMAEGFRHEIDSVRLRPAMRNELHELLSEIGFKDIKTFGNMRLERFDPATSTDLFAVARR